MVMCLKTFLKICLNINYIAKKNGCINNTENYLQYLYWASLLTYLKENYHAIKLNIMV